jgi:hypothetical protein
MKARAMLKCGKGVNQRMVSYFAMKNRWHKHKSHPDAKNTGAEWQVTDAERQQTPMLQLMLD